MPHVDDLTISGAIFLFRRIPYWGGHVNWDQDGQPHASSLNFRDGQNELSMHMTHETTPDRVLEGHDGFGLVQLTAAQVRDECGTAVLICRDEEDPADGHVLVVGHISGGRAKALSKLAEWVEGRWPRRIDPLTGQPYQPQR